MLDRLRSQVVSLESPVWAMVALDALVCRPIGELLVEVAMWDLDDAAEHTVSRGDPRLAGLDDETVLMRARTQAVIATTDSIKFVQVTVGGLAAEIAASNGYYLGACMLEALAHGDPAGMHLVVPVSMHHWILHAVTPDTDDDTVAGLGDLARAILDEASLAMSERLGTTPLWWPGNGLPARMRPWR